MPTTTSIQQQLRILRQSALAIERSVKRLTASLNGKPTGRRSLNLSPKRRAALKLHGRYLGHVRQLKPAQKAKVKALREKNGYHAAIALAKRLDRG